jgi:hypothetical protein
MLEHSNADTARALALPQGLDYDLARISGARGPRESSLQEIAP